MKNFFAATLHRRALQLDWRAGARHLYKRQGLLLTTSLVLAIVNSWQDYSLAQSQPFRCERLGIVTVNYDGSLHLKPATMGRICWGADISLLQLDSVRKYLKCSVEQTSELKSLMAGYRVASFAVDEKKGASKNLIALREKILDVLGESKSDQLQRLDRYLEFRQKGPADFIKLYCVQDSQDAEKLKQVADAQIKKWQEGLAKGQVAWNSSLTNIRKALPEEFHEDWEKLQTFWTQPLVADVVVHELDRDLHLLDSQKFRSLVTGLTNNKQKLPQGKAAYDEAIGNIWQFEMQADGAWKLKKYPTDPYHVLSYQLSFLANQDRATGKNQLDITSDQFAKIDQARNTYQRKLESLTGIGLGLQAGSKPASPKRQKAGKKRLAEEFEEEVWENVLFRFQKDLLVEDAQHRILRVRGPIAFFDQKSLRKHPEHRRLKSFARKEMVKFKKEMKSIELKVLKSLYDMSSSFDLGFSLGDRPDSLAPSLFNFSVQKQRLSNESKSKSESLAK